VQGDPATHARALLGRIINIASATVAIASPGIDRLPREQDGRHRVLRGRCRQLSAMMGSRSTRCPVTHPHGDGRGPGAAVVDASLSRRVIHRMAEPEDIAGSVLVLAAEDTGWITGQTITANGSNAFGL
jgi:3-oxoacyl-[acyl-carrier protein] reductase